jgi:hypothetical protein
MFTALVSEKTLSCPFVFKMFTALGICAVRGHKVAVQFVAGEARWIWHHHLLFAPRADLPAHVAAGPAPILTHLL